MYTSSILSPSEVGQGHLDFHGRGQGFMAVLHTLPPDTIGIIDHASLYPLSSNCTLLSIQGHPCMRVRLILSHNPPHVLFPMICTCVGTFPTQHTKQISSCAQVLLSRFFCYSHLKTQGAHPQTGWTAATGSPRWLRPVVYSRVWRAWPPGCLAPQGYPGSACPGCEAERVLTRVEAAGVSQDSLGWTV